MPSLVVLTVPSSWDEVNERPWAVTARLKVYFRVVNTGLPEAVEEVRALWVKEWIVRGELVRGELVRGELVEAEPGRRVGSCVMIISEIVEGSVWTRLVHNFVSSVAGEGGHGIEEVSRGEGHGWGGASQGLWAGGVDRKKSGTVVSVIKKREK